MKIRKARALTWAACAGLALTAFDGHAGGRLEWTGAVTDAEGAAGGGLVPWALIGGLGTQTQLGGSAFVTYVSTQDFTLRSGGVSIDAFDRVELAAARQRFDASSVAAGLTLGQDIVSLKLKLAGDAVFAPDQWLPQISVGAQWKHTLDFDAAPRSLGALHGSDVDLYMAATKLYFAAVMGRNVLLDASVRRTRANQFGLLGFGGGSDDYHYEPEMSAALWLTDPLLVGAEYRGKPNNLSSYQEDGAFDLFLAWAPVKNFSITTAFIDLGRIVGKAPQRGVYVSAWAGY